jgi:tetratricopeptide (TPR) repeat protein
MKLRLSALALTLVLVLIQVGTGPALAAGAATLLGKIVDNEGSAVNGIEVTVRGDGFEQTTTTDEKGRFKLKVPDATVEYEISFARDGYATHSEPLSFSQPGGITKEWKLGSKPLGAPTESMAALRSYNEGVRALQDGNDDLALEQFAAALVADPQLAEAHTATARIYEARDDHEQALLAADRGLAADPDNVEALRVRYFSLQSLGREGTDEALGRLAELDRSPETAIALYNDGVAARRSGNQKKARARYELAAVIDPSLVIAHSALAGFYLGAKEFTAALSAAGRVLELEPESPTGWSVRYNALNALGRTDEALAALEKLQEVRPDAVAQAFLDRGVALFDDGLVDDAIPALEQALRADPSLPRGHYQLGLCYMNKNRTAEARRHLETFLELAPDDPDAGAATRLIEVLARSD